MTVMYSNCTTNYQLTGEEKDEIFDKISALNQFFYPKEKVITLNTYSSKWVFYDGSGTEVGDGKHEELIKEQLKELESLQITSKDFIKRMYEELDKNDTINWGILLMNHEYGDHLIKVLPEKDNIYQEYDMEVWEGDEEMLAMSDEEFASFLKERIEAVSSKKAYMKIPYSEISILYSQNYYRDAYNVLYYFIKNKQNQWLLDDIKVEKEE